MSRVHVCALFYGVKRVIEYNYSALYVMRSDV